MEDTIEVKIVHLEPMYVASFPAYGPEPEDRSQGEAGGLGKTAGPAG